MISHYLIVTTNIWINILIFNPYLIIKYTQFTDWHADCGTFVRDTKWSFGFAQPFDFY